MPGAAEAVRACAAAGLAVAVASVAADGLWLVRWGLGAAVGLWELLRIRKRKVLI